MMARQRATPPFGSGFAHCQCGKQWSGHRICHCSKCHATFGGLSLFDAHKPGVCLDPAGLPGGLRLMGGIWRGPEQPEGTWDRT